MGLKDQTSVLDLDCLGGDRSLKLLRGMQGDGLRWRGGVAMRALLPIPSHLLQIRAQTGDRQENISGIPCADRPRNTHGIAEGTRGLTMNEHEIFAALVIDASTVKTGR